MPRYIVNMRALPTGEHEVHNMETCVRLPGPDDSLTLGVHEHCSGAVIEAQRDLALLTARGCEYCCKE